MDTNTRIRIRRTIKRIIEMLVEGDYRGVEAMTNGIRLRADYIESGVVDYGKRLIYPPPEAYDKIDVVNVAGKSPPQYSIRFRLFTEEEGHSDLELQATLLDTNPGADDMRVEVDNILVP